MNLNEITHRVNEIADNSDDPEVAHWKEDELYIDVLKAICGMVDLNGVELQASRYAKEALKARELDFDRWYA